MTILLDHSVTDFSFDDLILHSLEKVANERNISVDEVIKSVGEQLDQLITNVIVKDFKKSLDTQMNDYYNYKIDTTRGFEERLYEIWGKPLQLLDILITMCSELGAKVNNEFRDSNKGKKSYKLEVLTRLHAHAVHITCEILQLLKGGYSDGAMARWRSLHESDVIGHVINESSENIAEKYFLHKHIDNYRSARIFSQHADQLGFESITDEHVRLIKGKYDELIKKYGKQYSSDYGWAFGVIDKDKITFSDLEKFCSLNHLRPIYKFSSNSVHSGSKILDYKLSLSLSKELDKDDILLSGPSNEGLFDPIQCTAMSLIDITETLLEHTGCIDNIIFSEILDLYFIDLKNELIESDKKIRMKR